MTDDPNKPDTFDTDAEIEAAIAAIESGVDPDADAPEPNDPADPPKADPSPAEDEDTARARKYGWRDKTEFDREPEGWVPAKRYLGLPKVQNRILRDELTDLEKATAERIARLEAESAQALKAATAAQQRAYDARLAEIREAQEAAVNAADLDAARALRKAEDDLGPRPADPAPAGPDAAALEQVKIELGKYRWGDNEFFQRQAAELLAAEPSMENAPMEVRIAYADAQLEAKFGGAMDRVLGAKPATAASAPTTPASLPRTSSPVDPGGLAEPGAGAMRFRDLPQSVQLVARALIDDGVFPNEAAYVKAYMEEHPNG